MMIKKELRALNCKSLLRYFSICEK